MTERRTTPAVPRRFLTLFLFVIAGFLGLLYWVMGLPLRQAREELLAGRPSLAADSLSRWSRLGMRPEDFEQLLSAAYLAGGNERAAAVWLERAAQRPPDRFPAMSKEEVGRVFLTRGLYEPYLRWDAAVRTRGDGDRARLYRAAAQLGAERAEEAATTFSSIDREEVDGEAYALLERAIARRSEGSYPIVLDRNGGVIAIWQMANRDLVSVNSDFISLVDRDGGQVTIENHLQTLGVANSIETTLDPAVQKAAMEALRPFRGSLVAIDTRTNEILAVASTAGNGALQNLAFDASYEPGSIMKVFTGLAAYDTGIDIPKLLPMECEGWIPIDGRQFYDWARHGEIRSLDEAMAVSCNVAFARIGLKLGRETLKGLMSRALFDQSVDLGIFHVPLGKHVGPVDHNFMLANYAIGLEVQTVNALHVAMLAAMLANDGMMTAPSMVRARRSILGDEAGSAPAKVTSRVADPAAVARIVTAMTAVVEDQRGTGRRAAIEGIRIAMKTGTSGDANEGGYDSVVMAFAPADEPRIAFGMIAENAGPAELAGARIARDFLIGALGASGP